MLVFGAYTLLKSQVQQKQALNKVLVGAIDFGTTFSGWSFLFGHQYVSDATKVFAKNWNNGTNISSKTPTTILIAPDGKTLEKFGYEAEDRYAVLASKNEHKNYYYFRRFKMKLYEKMILKRDMILEDETGKQLPALVVFSLAIQFIRKDLLQECDNQIGKSGIDQDDIDWVITVPAIWNDAAKQFMREAAEKAGILTHKLTIAFEPEAASIFCKQLSVEKTVTSDGLSFASFSPGSTYIVLDAGGGTVDISAHEVLPNGGLRELHRASGGPWGGTTVDDCFLQFLIKLFGAPLMKRFKTKHMDDYLDIIRDFEVKKRTVKFGDHDTLFRIPATLMELFETETGEKLDETIQQMNFPGEVSLQTGNKLRLGANCMRNFFEIAVKSTLEHLQGLLMHPATRSSNFVLMVGGFSESVYLQENVKKTFPDIRIVIPPEAGLVVLKGAAIFGHAPDVISERISKYTYGFVGYRPFRQGIDPEEHAATKEGRKRLKAAFFKLVEVGEPVKINEKREWDKDRVATNDREFIRFPLYGSLLKNPVGGWSEKTFRIGVLEAKITNMAVPRQERKFRISGIFGETEIKLQALELSTRNMTTVTFDALNN